MAFLKKFDIKQICVVNHQDINILSNFGSRKTKNREMIGSSVKDFGSFYQKTLEPIFSKDRKTTALIISQTHCANIPQSLICTKKWQRVNQQEMDLSVRGCLLQCQGVISKQIPESLKVAIFQIHIEQSFKSCSYSKINKICYVLYFGLQSNIFNF